MSTVLHTSALSSIDFMSFSHRGSAASRQVALRDARGTRTAPPSASHGGGTVAVGDEPTSRSCRQQGGSGFSSGAVCRRPAAVRSDFLPRLSVGLETTSAISVAASVGRRIHHCCPSVASRPTALIHSPPAVSLPSPDASYTYPCTACQASATPACAPAAAVGAPVRRQRRRTASG